MRVRWLGRGTVRGRSGAPSVPPHPGCAALLAEMVLPGGQFDLPAPRRRQTTDRAGSRMRVLRARSVSRPRSSPAGGSVFVWPTRSPVGVVLALGVSHTPSRPTPKRGLRHPPEHVYPCGFLHTDRGRKGTVRGSVRPPSSGRAAGAGSLFVLPTRSPVGVVLGLGVKPHAVSSDPKKRAPSPPGTRVSMRFPSHGQGTEGDGQGVRPSPLIRARRRCRLSFRFADPVPRWGGTWSRCEGWLRLVRALSPWSQWGLSVSPAASGRRNCVPDARHGCRTGRARTARVSGRSWIRCPRPFGVVRREGSASSGRRRE